MLSVYFGLSGKILLIWANNVYVFVSCRKMISTVKLLKKLYADVMEKCYFYSAFRETTLQNQNCRQASHPPI